MSSTNVERFNLCGVPVDRVDHSDLFDRAVELCREPTPSTISYVNAHVHNLARRDDRLQKFLSDTSVCYADGASIVWGCRHQGFSLPGRLTAADFLPALLARMRDEGLRVYLLGSKPGVAEKATETLQSQVAGWEPAGVHHGYVSDKLTTRVVAEIRDSQPHLLIVGMGTPRQEAWVADNLNQLGVPLVWTVGALFDYFAGQESRCPKWMGDRGLEWCYRLAMQPGRMAGRYLLGNPSFMWSVLTARPPRPVGV